MSKKKKTMAITTLPVVRSDVAGVDIGSRQHWVAAPQSDADTPNVRVFSTTTDGLIELVNWLVSLGVKSVAMESTSVYWVPLFELLEARKIEAVLVNARHLHNVPGRKSDMRDCQWLQVLHSCGLLRSSFRPPEQIARIRAIHRQLGNLIGERTRAVQWMQKALDQMNVQVHRAVTDLTGATGMAIVRAIVAGERDANKLASLRDPRCAKSEDEVAKYLLGTWRDEHLFNLGSALRLHDFVVSEIERYNRTLDDELALLASEDHRDQSPPPLPNKPKEKKIIREGKADRRDKLYRATGVDLTRIDGLGVDAATTIFDELGPDLSAFPTEDHFVSWLRLCPNQAFSAGKPLPKKRKNAMGSNRVASVLRMAASTLARSGTALGAYYRRISHRKDGHTAVLATARKLAQLVYRALRFGTEYTDAGAESYERDQAARRLKHIQRVAKGLGFDLVQTPHAAASMPVSG
jgi:transposase